MILSIIFSVVSLLIFVFQLFTMEKGNRFFLSGATMLVCCEYLWVRLQRDLGHYLVLVLLPMAVYLHFYGFAFILGHTQQG